MKANDGARAPRTLALGRAIRRHRGETTQEDVAPALGVSQASISSWELGGVDLTCEQVAGLERRLGLRPGTLFMEAGYVEPHFDGPDGVRLAALHRLDAAMANLRSSLDEA